MLGVTIPLAVLARVAFADWISAVIIAVTLPLIPLFGILIGWHTRAQTQRQWQLLARLGGHFLDVVAGLPTLKLFGRARAQAEVIGDVTSAHRKATMATLRVAFLSALALELTAALATALVAVEIGLRLLAGHVGYQTALLVLLLTPEAYLPLRNAGAEFHASADGSAAARRAFEILDTPLPGQPVTAAGSTDVDLSRADIMLRAVSLTYPNRGRQALDEISLTVRPGEHIVLTGPSGAGKSSLLALLLRFATPASGAVTAGGVDLARIPDDRWLAQIAWVPQHPHLFAATVSRQHRTGSARGAAAGYRGGRPPGRGGRVHPPAARRLRHPAHRRRPEPVGRAAAEDRAGPGVPAPGSGPAARRAHRPPRPGQRRRGHDRHRDPDGRPHRHPHHPPAATPS